MGRIHAVLTFVFFNLVFFPMHFLGMGGMMRRIYNPTQYEFLQHLQPMAVFMSVCAFILGASQILFIWNFVASLFNGRKASRNPWHANTLEWAAESPAASRQLGGDGPDGLPGPLRVQRARDDRGLPAPEPGGRRRPGGRARALIAAIGGRAHG